MKKNFKNIAKILIVSFLLTSCASENLDIPNQDPSLAKAKKWFEASKPNLEVLDYTNAIDWNNAIVTDGIVGTVVEVPLILKENTSTNIGDDKSYKTNIRLMFIEDEKEKYKIYDVILTTDDNMFDNKNKNFNIYNVDNNYKGYVTLQNYKNVILDSKNYDKGQKIITPKKSNISAKWVCNYIIQVGNERACHYIWVEDPYNVNTLPYNPQPTGAGNYIPTGGSSSSSGSTSTGPPINTTAACYYALNDVTSLGKVISIPMNTIAISEDSNNRTKFYPWQIYNCSGYTVFSLETGVSKKVANADPNLQWQWVSLTHSSIYSTGTVAGFEITKTLNGAISNIVSPYNATMNLNFNVKFSLICQGFPIFKDINCTALRSCDPNSFN